METNSTPDVPSDTKDVLGFTVPMPISLAALSQPPSATMFAVEDKAAAGALVSVDANLRANIWPGQRGDVARVTVLLGQAQLIKPVQEDLNLLRGDEFEESYLKTLQVTPPKVKGVNTTVIGDSSFE